MAQHFDYPILCEPIGVPRPWGAGLLPRMYERPITPSEEPIGESWDLSTWPADPGNPKIKTVTKILNGKLAGSLLSSIIDLPVVVKVLDTAQKLSVQVHPVTPTVHKDEIWYVLYSNKNSYLYCGLKIGMDPAQFCRLIRDNPQDEERILDCLNRVSTPRAGDYFVVPSGTVHAVGPGIIAYEVSEKDQVTYRLFDYNRGRKLQIEEGCQAVLASREMGTGLGHGLEADQKLEPIVDFPTFSVVRARSPKLRIQSSKYNHLLTATMGDLEIQGPRPSWSLVIKHSFTCLIPRGNEPYTVQTKTGGEVLITSLA